MFIRVLAVQSQFVTILCINVRRRMSINLLEEITMIKCRVSRPNPTEQIPSRPPAEKFFDLKSLRVAARVAGRVELANRIATLHAALLKIKEEAYEN